MVPFQNSQTSVMLLEEERFNTVLNTATVPTSLRHVTATKFKIISVLFFLMMTSVHSFPISILNNFQTFSELGWKHKLMWTNPRWLQLRSCDKDMLADPLSESVAAALMCDKTSTAVQLLRLRVQGIMGCCTDGAEGWWKTVATPSPH